MEELSCASQSHKKQSQNLKLKNNFHFLPQIIFLSLFTLSKKGEAGHFMLAHLPFFTHLLLLLIIYSFLIIYSPSITLFPLHTSFPCHMLSISFRLFSPFFSYLLFCVHIFYPLITNLCFFYFVSHIFFAYLTLSCSLIRPFNLFIGPLFASHLLFLAHSSFSHLLFPAHISTFLLFLTLSSFISHLHFLVNIFIYLLFLALSSTLSRSSHLL